MNLFIFIIYSAIYELSPISFYSILISFLFGLLFPLIAILEFRRRGIISNNDATIKEERTLPYLFAIGFSLAGLSISSVLSVNVNLIMLWMIYLINSILILNINRFWKISAHAMGASMPLGALMIIQETSLILVSAIILILVAASRLYLKVHSFMQVLLGSIIGFTVSFVLLKYCL
jgi:membrane-associated phospholipid phosphatase